MSVLENEKDKTLLPCPINFIQVSHELNSQKLRKLKKLKKLMTIVFRFCQGSFQGSNIRPSLGFAALLRENFFNFLNFFRSAMPLA